MKTYIYTTAIGLFLLPFAGFSQTMFQTTLGKTGITTSGSAIVQTATKGFVVSGKLGLSSKGGIFELDSVGSVLWSKQYSLNNDFPVKMCATSDEGYIIGGNAKIVSNSQLMLLKVDALGEKQWAKTIGGTGIENCRDIKNTSDGGYIVLGSTASYGSGTTNFYAVKMDATGVKEWDYAYSPSPAAYSTQVAYTVCEMQTGGFVIGGSSNYLTGSTGNVSAYVVRTAPDGTLLWYKSYALDSSTTDVIEAVAQTNDGGLIFTGYTFSPKGAGSSDIFLLKTDSSGNIKWSKTYGGLGDDRSYTIQQTSDLGYVFGGSTSSFKDSGSYNQDFYLLKTDSLGNLKWSKTYGTSSSSESIASIITTSDGGYALSGNMGSGATGYNTAYVIKTDAFGNSSSGSLCTDKTPSTIVKAVNTFSTTPSSGVTTEAFEGSAFPVVLAITAATYTVNAIPVTQPGAVANSNTTICKGDSIVLSVAGTGNSYTWTPAYALTATQNDTVKAGPVVTTTYKALVSNFFCSDSASVVITLNIPPVKITASKKTICSGESTILSASGGSSYLWSPPAGLNDVTAVNVTASPKNTTRYKLIAYQGFCNNADSINIVVNPTPSISISESTTICSGNTAQITATGGTFYAWRPIAGLNSPNIANPAATPEVTTTYTMTTSNGLCLGSKQVTVTVTQLAKADFVFDERDSTFINLSTEADRNNWDFGDGTTSALSTPLPHVYPNGNYLARLIVNNACNSDTASLAIIVNIIAKDAAIIKELLKESNVLVFPNPNKGTFNLQAPLGAVTEIKLLDAAGSIVHEEKLTGSLNNNQSIVFNNLAKGFYTLVVSGKQAVITKKIIVL